MRADEQELDGKGLKAMMPFRRLDFDGGQRVSQRRSAICLLLLVFLSFPPELGIPLPGLGSAFADSETDDRSGDDFDFEEADRKVRRESSPRVARQSPSNLGGVNGRIGHIALPTFGRRNSITHVEVFPFLIDDNVMLFGDARFFLDNVGEFGTNGGAGLRRWVPAWERVFGASLWYDFDETSGKSFHGTGLSVESYGRFLDFRGNGYIPVGDREKNFFKRRTSFRYEGNQIVFDSLRRFAEAQAGFDLELGVAVPSQFAADHNLRVAGGFYHFLGDAVPDINGFRGRVEGSLTNSIDLQVELTDDNSFGTNVNFGVAFNFGPASTQPQQTDQKLRQMTRYVNRNYNIIVGRGYDNSYHYPAINPETGQPYRVHHVSTSVQGPGSGTQDDPFMTIAEAQGTEPDLILVHSGSVLNSSVILAPNQRILGEGVNHLVNVQGVGNVLLPTFTGGTALPILQGISGDAVTLASGSEFSGFLIDGPGGNGIVGNGIAGAFVRNVTIQNAAGDGIFLGNSTGSVLFENVNLTGIAGTAFHVNGGAADILVSGRIHNSAGRSVVLANTTGGSVNLEHTDIVDDGGTGVFVAHNAGNSFFGNVDVRNSPTTGIAVQGGTGTTIFTKHTTVANSAEAGINIENVGGPTHFHQTTILNNTGAPGVRIVNSTGTTTMSRLDATTEGGPAVLALNGGQFGIFGGTIAATNAAAVDVENTTVDFDLTRVSSSNAVNGIRLINSPGAIRIRGDGNPGSGGVIQGATVGVFAENSGTLAVQHMVLDGNTTGIMASNTENLFFHLGQVTNSASHGIVLRNVRRFELFGTTLEKNAGHSLHAHSDVAGDHTYLITGNVFNNDTASPIVLTTLPSANNSTMSLHLEANTFNMTAAGSQALDLNWNGELVSTLARNTITGTGDSSTGFNINNTSTTQLTQIVIGQNALTFEGADSVGTRLATSGSSEIIMGENSTIFNAASGIGADFTIGQSSNIQIFSNVITDNVSRGTGVLFSSITGNSTVTIDNNLIQLLSTDAFVDRGIIFNSVTGNVQLNGTVNNAIFGATTPFSAVGTTGQIIVNGVAVP